MSKTNHFDVSGFFKYWFDDGSAKTFNLGEGTYFRVNKPQGHLKTKDEDIQRLYGFWMDIDGKDPFNLDFRVPPSVIFNRGEKNYHVYWKFEKSIRITEGERDRLKAEIKVLGNRMSAVHGADKKVYNLSRMMRVPGTTKKGQSDSYQTHTKSPKTVTTLAVLKEEYLTEADHQEIQDRLTPVSNITGRQLDDEKIKEVSRALNCIDPDTDRDTWIHMGMALANTGHEHAFSVWDDWSRKGAKYDGSTRTQWKSFTTDGSGAITLGSLFHVAKQHGYEPPVKTFALNASGSLKRIRHYFKNNKLLYNHTAKEWYLYRKGVWINNLIPPFSVLDKLIQEALPKERKFALSVALSKGMSPKELEALEKSYRNAEKDLQTYTNKNNALRMLADEKEFAAIENIMEKNVTHIKTRFNTEADKIVFKNVTYNFSTGECEEHSYENYSTKQVPYNLDLEAECTQFLKFLKQILPDKALRLWMQMYLGSCLVGGENRNRIFPIFHGEGANGKSTLIEIVRNLFNPYVISVESEVFVSHSSRDNRFALSSMPGARILVISETEAGGKFNVNLAKQLTGNDTLVCERKGRDAFEFQPEFKPIFATNHVPTVSDNSDAIWDRIRLVPFEVRIEAENRDPNLREKLMTEAEGIINWLVHGGQAWVDNDYVLPECDKIDAATVEYKDEEDVVQNFIETHCEETETTKEGATVTQLYDEFKLHISSKIRKKEFIRMIERKGYDKEKWDTTHFNLKIKRETF